MKFRGGGAILALSTILTIFACAACAPPAASRKDNGGPTTMKDEGTAPVVYVAVGDSTGAGVGAKDGRGYVARLFTRIERERPHSHLTNLCVSGATTDDVLSAQVGPAVAARPTLLTLGVGINDVGRGVTVERFARNYEAIVSRLTAETGARVVVTNLPDVSFAPVAPAYMRAEVRRRILLFNERIKEIAGRHGVLVVDAYEATHDVIPSHPEFFSEDGFHPSDAGYEYWAKVMWPTVKGAIGG